MWMEAGLLALIEWVVVVCYVTIQELGYLDSLSSLDMEIHFLLKLWVLKKG